MIRKMKRFSVTIICLLIAIALAACGSSGNTSSSNTSDSSKNTQQSASGNDNSGKPVTLRFSWWGTDPRHQATLKAIDAYQKLHPNVKIQAEYMGFDGYYQKLLTQFAGNTAPDILQYTYEWDNDMADFLFDLKSSKSLDLSGMDSSVVKNFATYKDRVIMAPAGEFAAVTFYNQGFLQKFGIPEDTVWTWDNIMEIGKKVHAQDPNSYLLTADADVLNKLILMPYVSQLSGKNWINDDYTPGFTRDQLVKGLTYLSDLYKNGVIEPFGDSTAFVGKMEQNPKWIKGQIGLLLDYVQNYDKYKQSVPDGKLGVSAFPQAPNALQSGNPIIAGTGFAVSKNSPNAEEAIKFINWMINDKDAALILGTQRGIPAASSARQALQDAKNLDPNITKGIDLAGNQKAVAPNVISTNTELMQVSKDAFQKLIYQKSTPEQTADEIINTYASKLKEMKK